MKIISDKQLDKGKLAVSFADGQLVMIAKIYSDLTGKVRDPTRLSQKQINFVVNRILKQGLARMKE